MQSSVEVCILFWWLSASSPHGSFISFLIIPLLLLSLTHISNIKEEQVRAALRCVFLLTVNVSMLRWPWICDSEEAKTIVPLCWSVTPPLAAALSCHRWSDLMASSIRCAAGSWQLRDQLSRSNEHQHCYNIHSMGHCGNVNVRY